MTDLPQWHPDLFSKRLSHLRVRQSVLVAARRFFEEADFAEVDTPALQVSPGNEPHLHAFGTEWRDVAGGSADRPYYLHTSPEFAMKKLLVAGIPRLYQIAHVFRNGERSSRHHPEFTMLEWYRAGARLDVIKQDCIHLVRKAALAAARPLFQVGAMRCDPFGEWQTLSVPDAFMRYANIDLLATMIDPYRPDFSLLADQVHKAGGRVAAGDNWDDLFFRIMGEKIEPELGQGVPVFLCDYPVCMAALARPGRDDPRLAERFELYICGYELANAFDELTDAAEQERRFRADMDIKERIYGLRYPVDEDFIAALKYGLPESAGIALGFDRLVMLCAGTENIDDVLWLPVM